MSDEIIKMAEENSKITDKIIKMMSHCSNDMREVFFLYNRKNSSGSEPHV
jgi:hypothetical protein